MGFRPINADMLVAISEKVPWYAFAIGGTALLGVAKSMSDTALALKERADMTLVGSICNVPLSLYDWERLKQSDKWPGPKNFWEKARSLKDIRASAVTVPVGLLALATGAAIYIDENVPNKHARFWMGITIGTSLVGAKILYGRWLFNDAASKLYPIVPLSPNSPLCQAARDIHGKPAYEQVAIPASDPVPEMQFGLPKLAPVPIRSSAVDAAMVTVGGASVLAALWTLAIDAVAGLVVAPFPESVLHAPEVPGT